MVIDFEISKLLKIACLSVSDKLALLLIFAIRIGCDSSAVVMTLYLSFNGLINTLNTAVVSLSLPSVTLTFTCLDIGVDTLGATPLNVEWFNTFIGI